MKANWTTLLMGVMLGVCLTLLIGAGELGMGPYQLSSSGNVAWVIDTQTGQVWVTEKRAIEPDSPMVFVEKPLWYSYKSPLESSK
ncbi:MAG TPA: hypothetical protein ENN87_13565 [Phycisphaerales bacterium]|nr:hypothetical protein [Phycisphaerales bacterium]